MAKLGILGTIIAVEIACGLSAAAGCEDQVGIAADEASLEDAGLVLPPAERPSVPLSSVLWGGALMDVAHHEQINMLGGS